MPNRLAQATSPYLLQHADNPIDWWQWSVEAFEEARRRDVPVLLSIGYAACHWCHVMAHESFSHDEIAAEVNRDFVAIKVDREERPDVDAVYMAATLAMTGHGGWPMTCFLTPDAAPFHCGTYYPPTPRPGMPGFGQLLSAVTTAWQGDAAGIRTAAGRISAKLAEVAGANHPPGDIDAAALDGAADRLASHVDPANGGFGGAPKFPPAMVCEFLMRHFERTGSPRSLQVVGLTCERMARGGLYDQLAGGFARYSVDAQWVVPHFEKMLYDNALLLHLYAHLARRTEAALPWRVTEETAAFLLREMRTAEGGFASALDADTDGVEGLTYGWTPEQLAEVLGDEDGRWAARLLSVTEEGTFENGSSTLQLLTEPDDQARWERVREMLLAARAARPQPTRDDKVITGWNGLAIAALAHAGAAFDRPEWVQAAADAADLLLDLHIVDGRLRRSSRGGAVGAAAGVLEDHACLAAGLLALHQATCSARWLEAACTLLDLALAHFADPNAPGRYFDTADDAETLLHRPREITDNVTPAGASALAGALLTASVLVQPGRAGGYREAAEAALRAVGTLVVGYPNAAGNWLTVAEAALSGPLQVAVVGAPEDTVRAALSTLAHRLAPGGTVVLSGEPDQPGVPLLADRPLVAGAAAAYVCRGFVCDRPAVTAEELLAALP